MRILYDILFLIFALFYLPFFIAKGRHKEGLGCRLGFPPREALDRLKGRPVIWIHAVSVGEMTQAVQLAEALRGKSVFLLTATTPAGLEAARRLKHPDDSALYFPVDFRFSVRSFIRRVGPKLFVAVETEIWPNLFFELSKKNVPTLLINGRISDKAYARYRFVKPFFRPVLRLVRGIGAQSEAMRGRFLALGADPARVRVTGNVKWDWRPPQNDGGWPLAFKAAAEQRGWFFLAAGSTHEGEEAALLGAFASLKSRWPRLRLFLAPRHLERLDGIEALVSARGLRIKRLCRREDLETDLADPEVCLLGRMGILPALYEAARIVFVGGSLVPVGGHNPVEPAFFAKPILFGPHMENFHDIADEFKKYGAALEVTKDGLATAIDSLMTHAETAEQMGLKAKDRVSRRAGALQKNIEMVMEANEP